MSKTKWLRVVDIHESDGYHGTNGLKIGDIITRCKDGYGSDNVDGYSSGGFRHKYRRTVNLYLYAVKLEEVK